MKHTHDGGTGDSAWQERSELAEHLAAASASLVAAQDTVASLRALRDPLFVSESTQVGADIADHIAAAHRALRAAAAITPPAILDKDD